MRGELGVGGGILVALGDDDNARLPFTVVGLGRELPAFREPEFVLLIS